MQGALEVFDYEGSKVRTVEIDGEAWFVGKDVATVLGYKDTRSAISGHVDEEDRRIVSNLDERQNTAPLNDLPDNTVIINESGVYSLIFESKLPAAKKFKHWVTSVVLPQIHKTGSYRAKPLDVSECQLQQLNLERAKFLQHMIDVPAFPLTDESKAVIAHEAFKLVTGHEYLGMLPANTEQWYTASDIGELLGISANKVGRIAKEYGLKPPVGESNEYGRWIYSKSKYSPREVPSFVYTKAGLDWFMDYREGVCKEA